MTKKKSPEVSDTENRPNLEETLKTHLTNVGFDAGDSMGIHNIDDWWYNLERSPAHEFFDKPEPARVAVIVGYDVSKNNITSLRLDYKLVDYGFRDDQLDEFSSEVKDILEKKGLMRNY